MLESISGALRNLQQNPLFVLTFFLVGFGSTFPASCYQEGDDRYWGWAVLAWAMVLLSIGWMIWYAATATL